MARLYITSMRVGCIALLFASAGAADVRANSPERISNTVPYRVSRPSSAKGRAGSATLTARALLRKSGETDIELTTGDLDGASSRLGSITGVQIATTDALGHRQMVKEYPTLSGVDGYVAFMYTGLLRGQPLRVQANVAGIDGTRTDVVSATPSVRLRPDLSVHHVSAPATGLVNVPITITAVIGELNQDVGARASCRLFVDGFEVDHAAGLWVDAGGQVSCAFTYTFETAGTKSVQVQATDVAPMDFDLENNSATTSIRIATEQLFDWYAVDSISFETTYGSHYQDWSTRGDGSTVYGQDVEDERLMHQTDRYIGYQAIVHKPVTFPLTQFSAVESTDGALVRAVVLNGIGVGGSSGGCAMEFAGSPLVLWLQICSHTSGTSDGAGFTSLQYGTATGDVTYFSRGFDAAWHQSPDGTVTTDESYSWNDSASSHRSVPPTVDSAPAEWGATYDVDVTVVSGDTIFRGPLTMVLQRRTVSRSVPWQCTEAGGDWGWRRSCFDLTDERVVVSGYAPR